MLGNSPFLNKFRDFLASVGDYCVKYVDRLDLSFHIAKILAGDFFQSALRNIVSEEEGFY